MKKIFLAIFALALTGCYDLSSPEGAVKSLGYTIVKNKYKNYKSVMMGEARAQYGNREEFAKARAQSDLYKEAKVSKAKLIDDDNSKRYMRLSVYEVTIDLGESNNKLATVNCVENYGWHAIWPEDVMSLAGFQSPPVPPPMPPPPPIPPREEYPRNQWWSTCQITKIES